MFFENKRILVTGGTGFIGKQVVSHLIKQNPVLCIIDKNIKEKFEYQNAEHHEADIYDKNILKKIVNDFCPDYIIHLAANNSHEDNPEVAKDIERTNIHGTRNLLEATKEIPYKRFIFLSSGEAYFGNKVPFREGMEVKGPTAYSRSKIESEKDCREFIEKYKKPIVILRASIVYGPGQKAQMFIPSIIESAMKKIEFSMTPGEQTRDFIFVYDLVDAIIKACMEERAIGETINIGSGIPVKLLDVTKVAESLIPDLNKKIGAKKYRENELFEYYFDISKAKTILNWSPKHELKDGLAMTIQWRQKQK